MTQLKVLNEKMQEVADFKTSFDFSTEKISVPVVHQVVKATLASRRQGNACTKNKSQVRGGGKKPFKQKGTGRARQGSTRSPLMPGGGTVFGPTPRSYEQKVNKKVMLRAIESVIVDKFHANKLVVVEKFPNESKTKFYSNLLSGKGIKSVLVVSTDVEAPALRGCRNLQFAKALPVDGFSVYECVKHEYLLIEKSALETLIDKLV